MAPWRRIIFAAALLLPPLPARAMRGSRTLYPVSPYDVGVLVGFDYTGAGLGSLTWALALTDPSTQRTGSFACAFACTEDELTNNLLANYASPKALCAASDAELRGVCSAYARTPAASASAPAGSPAPPTANGTLLVSAAVTMDLLYAICPDAAATDMSSMLLTAAWHATNPGGEELPRGEIPLKQQELDFGVAWCVLGAAWAANLAYATARRGAGAEQARAVHAYLLLPPLFFSLEGFIGAVYWRRVSASGLDDLPLSLADTFSWDVASSVLVYLIMRLARGWQITRPRLTALEERNVALLALFYLLSWGAWQYSYSILSLFSLLFSYALILHYAAASAAWSLRLLQVFRSFAESLGIARAGSSGSGSGSGSGAASLPQSATAYQSLGGAEEGGASSAGPAGAEEPEDGAVVDGGLSGRQVAFLSTFRYVFIAYLSADMLCEIASDLLFARTPWVRARDARPLSPLPRLSARALPLNHAHTNTRPPRPPPPPRR